LSTSIQNRLLVTTTCVLVLFLTITGFVLDRSFQASVVAGAQEQLRLVIYSLLGAAEEEDGQFDFSQGLPEPRLEQPESGLYAQISNELGESLWVSPSALTTEVRFPVVNTEPGVDIFAETNDVVPRFVLSQTIIWEDVDNEQVVFAAATDQLPFRASIAQFRRSLWFGLGAATVFFIMAQLAALRWGLLPLRTMAEEVQELQEGERDALSDAYPRELTGLAANLDQFVEHEKRSRSRYRNALEDLAHSLKTPLAVAKNALLEKDMPRDLLDEQIERMETTVTHQLSRASLAGPVVMGKPVALDQMVERLLRALQTAYADRGISVTTALEPSVTAIGDERDFMEMLGNLLENAFKYSRSKVRVSVHDGASAAVEIEDDGAGIPEALREEVLSRGTRLDEIESGQGIGLAVVSELVELYDGTLTIEDSELGGAKVVVRLA
jgi:two-component system sensor histidine kinase PhoQ